MTSAWLWKCENGINILWSVWLGPRNSQYLSSCLISRTYSESKVQPYHSPSGNFSGNSPDNEKTLQCESGSAHEILCKVQNIRKGQQTMSKLRGRSDVSHEYLAELYILLSLSFIQMLCERLQTLLIYHSYFQKNNFHYQILFGSSDGPHVAKSTHQFSHRTCHKWAAAGAK